MIDLRLGDCLEVLRTMPDASVDAVVTDPPYCSGGVTESGRGRARGQGLRSETLASGRFDWFQGDNMTTAGLCWLLRELAVESARVLRSSGSLLVFCDWRMSFMAGPAMESAGLRLRNVIAWDKGHFGCGTGFRPQHELILHLSSRAPEFFSASVGNVITCKRVTSAARHHPTEKPVDLMGKLIQVVCPPQGVVLDPFMGSGSTGVAASMLGRDFIGIERDPAYLNIARSRIVADAKQLSLVA